MSRAHLLSATLLASAYAMQAATAAPPGKVVASAVVDGFTVDILPLPTKDVFPKLTATSGNVVKTTGSQGVGVDPFQGIPKLENVSPYWSMQDGSTATISLPVPSASFTFLWGTPDSNQSISLYDIDNQLIGTIQGGDFETAFNINPGNRSFPIGQEDITQIFSSTPIKTVILNEGGGWCCFEFSNVSSQPQFATLFTFPGGGSGSTPNGGLVLGSAGLLYGTTFSGGSANDGTLFSLNPADSNFVTLYSFAGGTNGAAPVEKLTIGAEGILYGDTEYGGPADSGTVFSFALATQQLTTIYAFKGLADGASPGGGLLIDSNGNLDGNAELGGADNLGAIFQITPNTGTEKTLYSFTGKASGDDPAIIEFNGTGMIVGDAKKGGGAANAGTLFTLNPTTKKLKTLYKFSGGANGTGPSGELAFDASGNMYGTTLTGGASNVGTIFKYTPSSATLKTLYSFTGGTDGGAPLGGLLYASYGVLYGTTNKGGGTKNSGTRYSVNLATNALTTLHAFSGKADGGQPNHAPVFDQAGEIVGTTRIGGADGFGTIYKFVP